MINKTVVVLGDNKVRISAFIEAGSGLPVLGLSDFGRDISGEDLDSLNSTTCDEVQIIVGSLDAAQSLHSALTAILKAWEDAKE